MGLRVFSVILASAFKVLIHLGELILALTCVFTLKSADAYDLLESHALWPKMMAESGELVNCSTIRHG